MKVSCIARLFNPCLRCAHSFSILHHQFSIIQTVFQLCNNLLNRCLLHLRAGEIDDNSCRDGRYILNDLANEVLFNASNAMNRRLYNEFKAQGYHLSTRLTPGENHLSMEYQAQFLSLLTQGEPFPATLTEHYMLQPEKAMLYAYGAGTGLPDRSIDHDCSKCPNLSCYMRRDTNP